MNQTETEKKERRAARFWRTWRPVAGALMRLRFGYRYSLEDIPQGGFLLYANHVTDLDPVFVGCSIRRMMAFVAGENLQRMGLLSRIVNRYTLVIDRYKGSTDAACALQVLRTLRKGIPVCMFPSGERSFSGKSVQIHPASAKLAKSAKVPLITYRITGGYLTSPRWADSLRRGSISGAIVHTYSVEELNSLSAEELHKRIETDLYEDAYAAEPTPYHGKRLAERLETMLYLCPKCGRVDTMRSAGSTFSCTCGMKAWLTETGRFDGAQPFAHPGAWDEWQQQRMREISAAATDAPVFSDEGQQLYRHGDQHKLIPVTAGTMSMSGTTFTLGKFSAPLAAMEGIALTQKDKLSFTQGGEHYEIRSDHPRCAKKYCDLFRYRKE